VSHIYHSDRNVIPPILTHCGDQHIDVIESETLLFIYSEITLYYIRDIEKLLKKRSEAVEGLEFQAVHFAWDTMCMIMKPSFRGYDDARPYICVSLIYNCLLLEY